MTCLVVFVVVGLPVVPVCVFLGIVLFGGGGGHDGSHSSESPIVVVTQSRFGRLLRGGGSCWVWVLVVQPMLFVLAV